jgi:hypothetical protein
LRCHTLLCSLIKFLKHFLNSFARSANNSFVTFLLMSSVSSNHLSFREDLILGNKKSLVGLNQENMRGRGWFNSGIRCLAKTALLILQCAVSRCHARETSFIFPETEVILDEFFEPNQTILPLPSSEESFDDQLKSIHQLFRPYQVFERLLVVHCVRHFRDFYGCPEILHTIKKPVYEREHCHHKPQLESFSGCFARLETEIMFALCSITRNCQYDLHGTKF